MTNELQCDGWEGPCDSTNAIRYRMNAGFEKEELNYRNLCPDCIKLCDAHWEEMWDWFNKEKQ